MATILRQLPNSLYTTGLGVVTFYPLKTPGVAGVYGRGYRLGDCDAFTIEIEKQTRERKSKEHNVLMTVLEQVSEIKANVSLTVMQLSDVVRAASLMGENGTWSQGAAVGQTVELGDVEPGLYWTGAYAVTNATASAAGMPAVYGTDWIIDGPSGQIEVLKPLTDLTVTHDIQAIDEAFMSGIGSSGGLRGMIKYVGTNDDGVKAMVVLRDVQLSAGGARSLIAAGTDFEGIQLSGIATPVSGVAGIMPGTEIGFETDVPKIV